MTCRKPWNDVKTEWERLTRDKFGSNLFTAQRAVSQHYGKAIVMISGDFNCDFYQDYRFTATKNNKDKVWKNKEMLQDLNRNKYLNSNENKTEPQIKDLWMSPIKKMCQNKNDEKKSFKKRSTMGKTVNDARFDTLSIFDYVLGFDPKDRLDVKKCCLVGHGNTMTQKQWKNKSFSDPKKLPPSDHLGVVIEFEIKKPKQNRGVEGQTACLL